MTYLDAMRAAVSVGRFAVPGADLAAVAHAVEAARLLPRDPSESDRLLGGLASPYRQARIEVPAFISTLLRIGDPGAYPDGEMRWLSMTGFAASGVWDHDRWSTLIGQYVGLCRQQGALTQLRLALTSRVILLLVAGELAETGSVIGELQAAVSATGSNLVPYAAIALAAFTGREAEASAMVAATVSDAERHGEGLAITAAEWASAVLNNGLGHYRQALAAAQRSTAYPQEDLGLGN